MLTQTVAGRTYDFSHAVGGRYLQNVVASSIGSGDIVYVLCRGSEFVGNLPWNKTGAFAKVTKISSGMVPGDEELLGEFGKYGDGEGEFIWAVDIDSDSQENYYVLDEWMNRVSMFDKDGNFIKVWGSSGDGDGELNGPSGIAFDRDDNPYIVDSRNHRVQKFTRDGKFLAKWGSLGDREGELDSPWGITIDHDGFVYVADHNNHRVQKLTPDGEYVASFGSYGSGRGQLDHPSDVAVDRDGDVYVCDWANDRVQIFEADGKFITGLIGDAQVMAKWHQQTVDANLDVVRARRRAYSLEPEWRLAVPTGVVFDPVKERLLISDTQRGRIQIYNKVKDYVDPQFNL